MKEEIKPSKYCKQQGFKTLTECSRVVDVKVPTLRNWSKYHPVRFRAVVAGGVFIKNNNQ